MKALILFFIMLAHASAQFALTVPSVGFLQDGSGAIRAVSGFGGSFVLGDPIAGGAVSTAFSGLFGLVKTDTSIIVLGRFAQSIARVDAPAGPALFAFSKSGVPAFAYLPANNSILAWDGQAFETTPIDLTMLGGSQVLSITTDPLGRLVILAQQNDGIWRHCFDPSDGGLFSVGLLTGIAGPLLVLANGAIVYTGPNGFVVRASNGLDTPIPMAVPDHFTLQQMGESWVSIHDWDTGQQTALQTAESHVQSYALPGVSQ